MAAGIIIIFFSIEHISVSVHGGLRWYLGKIRCAGASDDMTNSDI